MDSLRIQVFKEMVHFKSKDNLSPAQVKAFFCETGWSCTRSATNTKWLSCAPGYAEAWMLTLSI